MLNQVLLLKNELDTLRPLGREQEAIIMQKFRLDWNYHSNHLEGNSLTYGETKALILFGLTAQGKPLKDHFEITGHDEAVKWIEGILKQERPLTESFIRELHTLLLQKSYEVDAITSDGKPTKRRIEIGQYKTTPNHILTQTGEMFYFASPEETPAKMFDLMEWFREKQLSSDTEPVLLAAEFHYRFIRIHPFDDGNGRTARLLMNFILMQYGYPPAIIKTQDKQNYFNVLRLADAGNIEPFVNYIAENLSRSLEIMIRGAKGKSIEEPDDLDKEIALLEQKLKGVGKNLGMFKNKETVIEIYNGSLLRLNIEFLNKSLKFDNFYSNTNITLSIGTENYSFTPESRDFSIERMQIISNNFYNKTDNISLNYQYLDFKNPYIQFFNFQSSIDILFEKENYIVASGNLKLLKKLYSEQLTDKEISLIVNTEMKRHTAFIEAKIKEIQA